MKSISIHATLLACLILFGKKIASIQTCFQELAVGNVLAVNRCHVFHLQFSMIHVGEHVHVPRRMSERFARHDSKIHREILAQPSYRSDLA
jgi:hypothetical protein